MVDFGKAIEVMRSSMVSEREQWRRELVQRELRDKCAACEMARLHKCTHSKQAECERAVVVSVETQYAPGLITLPDDAQGAQATDTGFKLTEESLERRVRRKAKEQWGESAGPATPKADVPPTLPPRLSEVTVQPCGDRDAFEVFITFRVPGQTQARRAQFQVDGKVVTALAGHDVVKCLSEAVVKAMLKAFEVK